MASKYDGWEKIRRERLDATKEKRARAAQYQKERRERLKSEGICIRCATDKAIPGKTLCARCGETSNLKRRGIKQPYKPGKKQILTPEQKAIYAQRNTERMRQRNDELKRKGLCVYCGNEKALPGLTSCMTCRLQRNQARYGYVEHTGQWYEKERKAGRCL